MRILLFAAVLFFVGPARAQTIVIDPGHGGEDPGAVGVAEVDEKELTLRTSLALRDALIAALPTAVVLMTRDDDSYPTLDDRAALANRHGADLLLSVHYNAAENPQAEGIETFWLAPEGTLPGGPVPGRPDDGPAIVRTEVGVVGDLTRLVVDDLVRDASTRRSANAAEGIHRALIVHTRAPDRGVRQAQFRVLRGLRCPAIVVELGFLTHAREGNRVLETEYEALLVEGIVRGVVEFFEEDEAMAAPYRADLPLAGSAVPNTQGTR